MNQPLSTADITERLKELPNWRNINGSLVRTFEFASYLDGLEFVHQVALESDRMDHHPSMLLEYKKVMVSYSTHSARGITNLDFYAAKKVDSLMIKK